MQESSSRFTFVKMTPHYLGKDAMKKRFVLTLQPLLFGLLLALSPLTNAQPLAAEFDPGKATFEAFVNDRPLSYHTSFQPVLASQSVTIRIGKTVKDKIILLTAKGAIAPVAHAFQWNAPSVVGHYPVKLVNETTGDSIELHFFVMAPSSAIKDGKLNGYRIGSYPAPLRGLAEYRAPVGYIQIDKNFESIQISPHFTLGQFLCKQAGGYPKYVALRPRLLEKLELLLEDVNTQGIRTDGFVVMSGYRTPYYNRSIGNVSNSRHMYGGAADIFIDVAPKNNYMDDLNGDGKVTIADAVYLYKQADTLVKRTGRRDLVGGVGQYDKNPNHGPFVHVDVRGSHARWGH